MNKKFKVGLIRVLTTEDEEVLQSHGKQIMEYFPELEVVTKCIPDQYEGIHTFLYGCRYDHRKLCR